MTCDKYYSCPNRDEFSCSTQRECPSLPSCLRVLDEHHIHLARRNAMQRAEMLGMSSLESHYVATAVSELANNLFFHTKNGGTLEFHHVEKDGKSGIEVVAHDQGPGIIDIEAAMEDGFSTNGSLGAGLGGTQRLMDEFEITSEWGVGTRIVTRKWVTETMP